MAIVRKTGEFLFSICLLIGLSISYPNSITVSRVDGNPFRGLLTLIVVAFCIYFIYEKHYASVSLVDWFLGFLLSVLYNATSLTTADKTNQVSNSLSSTYVQGIGNITLLILGVVSWWFVTSCILAILKKYFGLFIGKSRNIKVWQIWLVIIFVWFVTCFTFLPGQISWDAWRQFCEFERHHLTVLHFTYQPTNHQPWFTTLIFGSVFTIGKSLGSSNLGVFLVVCLQILACSFIYAFAVKYIWHTSGDVFGIISLLFFCTPIFSTYAFTIDKSTIYYALCVALYTEFLIMSSKAKSNKPISYIYWVGLVLTSFLISEFRNDSFVIVIVFFAILLFKFKDSDKRKRLLISLATYFILIGGWNIYLHRAQIIPSASSEPLTLPTRQLSYVYLKHPGDFNNEEVKVINKVTPVNKIKQNFDLSQGDNLKNLYPSNTFLNSDQIIRQVVSHKTTLRTTELQKKEIHNYLKLWVNAFFKHPLNYFYVYLGANSKYLNPFIPHDADLFVNDFDGYGAYIIQPSWFKKYHPLFHNRLRSNVVNIIYAFVTAPPISLVINVGLPIWLTILLWGVVLTDRRKTLASTLIPLSLMCLMYTVTPVNGYSRYTIGVMAVLPVIISYLWVQVHNLRIGE